LPRFRAEYDYTGQRWEEAIGLYDYDARWYDPELGRFIQPDSVVPEPGNSQALIRYAYGLNNPVRYVDPTGHYGDAVHYGKTASWAEEIAYKILIGEYADALTTDQAEDLARTLGEQIATGDVGADALWSLDNSAIPWDRNVHFMTHGEAIDLVEK